MNDEQLTAALEQALREHEGMSSYLFTGIHRSIDEHDRAELHDEYEDQWVAQSASKLAPRLVAWFNENRPVGTVVTSQRYRLWDVRLEPDPIVLIFRRDGTVGFEHLCTGGIRWGEGVSHRVAPALDPDHHIVTWGPEGPSVTPSILCSDCQMHGFVTNGLWRDA